MTSKSAFEISSDQKVHLVSAANKIGKFSWPGIRNKECIDKMSESQTKAGNQASKTF